MQLQYNALRRTIAIKMGGCEGLSNSFPKTQIDVNTFRKWRHEQYIQV